MKSVWRLAALCGAMVVVIPWADAATPKATRTYAVIVANNSSDKPEVEPLRFADDDGARFYEFFSDFADETRLLTTLDADSQRIFPGLAADSVAPNKKNLDQVVSSFKARIEADKSEGYATELYLVFSGHGDMEAGEGYLSLSDSRLRRSELWREVIRPLDADFTHLIIDACHAYFMVRSRGGKWKDDRTGETLDRSFAAFLSGNHEGTNTRSETVGVILATAGAAEVHEWSRFRAGVFSHELRSGLLGAADADSDGRITYPEIEAYLAAANAAVTNPKARIQVFAKAPAQDRARPLLSLKRFNNTTTLKIPNSPRQRYHIEDSRGLRYADLHVDTNVATRIHLLRRPVNDRPYFLRTEVAQATVPNKGGVVSSQRLDFEPILEQPRGSVEESFRTNLFATPFGPRFVSGYTAGREWSENWIDAEATTDPERWEIEWDVQYRASEALLRRSGWQHGALGALVFSHLRGWTIGGFANYGLSTGDGGAVHRIAFGLDGGLKLIDRAAFTLSPRLRVGHQIVLVAADTLRADPLGVHGEFLVEANWHLFDDLSLTTSAGLALDVVTKVDMEQNHEDLAWSPLAGLGLRF
jgi:hypothetical protein